MPITAYDEEAARIGLVRPAARGLRWKVLGALIAGVCCAVALAYLVRLH